MRSIRLGLLRAEHNHYDKTEPLLLEAVEGRLLKLGEKSAARAISF